MDGQSKGRPGDIQSGISGVSVSPEDKLILPGNGNTGAIRQGGSFIPAALIERLPPMYHADRDRHFVFRNKEFFDIAKATFPEFQS